MTVNFTGIKNAGAMILRTPNPYQKMRILSLQVTNDEDGNDLDEFNKAIEKTENPQKYKTKYKGAVNINVFSTEPDEEYGSTEHKFYLNGSLLKVNDKNLPVFSYLAKLTTKIENKNDNELGSSIDYVQTPDFINGSSIGYFIKQAFVENPNTDILFLLNNAYNPQNTKVGAGKINSAIDEAMTDYFA